jgi:hypothetical protein
VSQLRRDWTDARSKVDHEGRCRVCKRRGRLEAAHVIGRANDRRKPCRVCNGAGKLTTGHGWGSLGPCDACNGAGHELEGVLYVHPDSIVPLCSVCHSRYDGSALPLLDLLPYLTIDEQVRAVQDAGGLELARHRTARLAYRSDQPQVPEVDPDQ